MAIEDDDVNRELSLQGVAEGDGGRRSQIGKDGKKKKFVPLLRGDPEAKADSLGQ